MTGVRILTPRKKFNFLRVADGRVVDLATQPLVEDHADVKGVAYAKENEEEQVKPAFETRETREPDHCGVSCLSIRLGLSLTE